MHCLSLGQQILLPCMQWWQSAQGWGFSPARVSRMFHFWAVASVSSSSPNPKQDYNLPGLFSRHYTLSLDCICTPDSSRLTVCGANTFCSLHLCSGMAAEPLVWLEMWGHRCFPIPAWYFATVFLKLSAFIPAPLWKYLHHGSLWVCIALLARLPLIVFVLEMTTVIFLAALIKTRLLKSSSMLLINYFDAASTLRCCCVRFSFFFFNQ